jgi:hypothetical protein
VGSGQWAVADIVLFLASKTALKTKKSKAHRIKGLLKTTYHPFLSLHDQKRVKPHSALWTTPPCWREKRQIVWNTLLGFPQFESSKS